MLVRSCRISRYLLVGMMALAAYQASAQGSLAEQAYIVGNDPGGFVGARADEIASLNQARLRVEIRGDYCYSSCTMFLGAEEVCVLPRTMFGFHGPSRAGRSLTPSEFEHFSEVMASHYSDTLRAWFMSEARYTITEPHLVRGSNLIALGYERCSD